MVHVQLKGCPNLHQVVLSPIDACPALTTLDFSNCCGLKYVLIQSMSISQINLSNNTELTKVCFCTLLVLHAHVEWSAALACPMPPDMATLNTA
jgi:hypothetical protein